MKSGALPDFAFDRHTPSEALDKFPYDKKPEPASFDGVFVRVSCDIFGRKKWVENLVEIFLGDSSSGILDGNFKFSIDGSAADGKLAGPVHGVAGIHKKIKEHILHRMEVGLNQGKILREILMDQNISNRTGSGGEGLDLLQRRQQPFCKHFFLYPYSIHMHCIKSASFVKSGRQPFECR